MRGLPRTQHRVHLRQQTLWQQLACQQGFNKAAKDRDSQWRLLSEELENVSHRTFLPGRAAPWTGLERSAYWNSAATREPVHTGVKLPYREVFVGLAQAIVELFLMRYNSLGCSPREQTALADLGKLFFQHHSPPPFGARAPTIPQQSFSDLKVQQLIEVWFAHHPLSFTLSKTLLLHAYRNGAHDHELLALVLAEASFFLGNEDISVSHAILEAARARVLERSTASLSTMQALALLGWHDVCLYRPRQGYCYLELARMMAAQRLSATTQASPAERHINGVDMHAVETELSQRTFWFTSSFALWVALHTDSPDLDSLSPLDTTPLPAPDLSSSAVYSLDEPSGTVASLVAQKTGARELWSLSHITSTLGPILSLHLQNTTSPPLWTVPTPSPTPHALLQTALSTRLPPSLDHSNPNQTLLLATYHLLALHLASPVTAATVVPSVRAFLAASQTIQRQAALQDLFGGRDHDVRSAPLLVLGLDTCARALARVGGEARTVAALAGRLWEVAGHRKLRLEPGLLAARERVVGLVGLVAARGEGVGEGGSAGAGDGGFGEWDEGLF
ncbi:protein kinase subdomain-containing protein [Neofusicoccum parvum]|nr:protein kinase subdomain-containing protein [Neofusicoccum parvum]